jgi:hypothetical protein
MFECCREILENTNVTFNANDTVTYVPKRRVQAEPEMSLRDAHADRIIVPNVALLVSCVLQRHASQHDACTTVKRHINTCLTLRQCSGDISAAEIAQRRMK